MNLNDDYNKALTLFNSKKYNEAIKACEHIILNDQNHYATWNLLGNIFFNLNDLETSKQFFIKALNIKPDFLESYHMLGNVLFSASMYEDAINIWEEALKISASHNIIHENISNAYIKIENYTEAEKFALQALQINKNSEDAYTCLVNIYKLSMNLSKLKDTLQKLLSINPKNAKGNFDLSYIYFLEKNYEKAYKHYEFRKYLPEEKDNYGFLPFKEYKKQSLKNKSLLIYHEQGFGDNIQFARFLSHIDSNNISFGIQNSLNRLFTYNFPKINFLKEINTKEKSFDYILASMSTPYMFDILQIESKAYLKVKDEDIKQFKENKLSKNKLNIGIAWSGSSTSALKDKKRVLLNDFEPLFKEDREFYSLQVENLDDLENYPFIKNIGKEFNDFYDTAVAISSLDLIISIDTAVAHLTGALGQKGFILSNINQFDFRWENENKKSIWYDSLEVYKYDNLKEEINEIDKDIDEL